MYYISSLLAFFMVFFDHVPPLIVINHLSWDSRQYNSLVFNIFLPTVLLVCYLAVMISSKAMADWSLGLLALSQQRQSYPIRDPVGRTRDP